MPGKSFRYQKFQLGGWLLYGLIMVLSAFLYRTGGILLYARLLIAILSGIVLTHLLRWLIRRLRLQPPLPLHKLPVLLLIVFGFVFLYALANSAMAQWLHMYPSSDRVAMGRMFIANILFEGPIILLWACVYYLWHYVESGMTVGKKISDLEKLEREMKQELGFSEP